MSTIQAHGRSGQGMKTASHGLDSSFFSKVLRFRMRRIIEPNDKLQDLDCGK